MTNIINYNRILDDAETLKNQNFDYNNFIEYIKTNNINFLVTRHKKLIERLKELQYDYKKLMDELNINLEGFKNICIRIQAQINVYNKYKHIKNIIIVDPFETKKDKYNNALLSFECIKNTSYNIDKINIGINEEVNNILKELAYVKNIDEIYKSSSDYIKDALNGLSLKEIEEKYNKTHNYMYYLFKGRNKPRNNYEMGIKKIYQNAIELNIVKYNYNVKFF